MLQLHSILWPSVHNAVVPNSSSSRNKKALVSLHSGSTLINVPVPFTAAAVVQTIGRYNNNYQSIMGPNRLSLGDRTQGFMGDINI